MARTINQFIFANVYAKMPIKPKFASQLETKKDEPKNYKK